MKTKKEHITYINQHYKANLNATNTSYSKVNKSKMYGGLTCQF
jgi:hypothetical protein